MKKTYIIHSHTQSNAALTTHTHIPSKLGGIRFDWKTFSRTFDTSNVDCVECNIKDQN